VVEGSVSNLMVTFVALASAAFWIISRKTVLWLLVSSQPKIDTSVTIDTKLTIFQNNAQGPLRSDHGYLP
jgi:phosphoglycerate-specific signal transduction histidine kinase